MPLQKITPFLWFDNQAEEAANLYVSIFPNSKIVKTVRYGAAGPGPAGSVMTVQFELDGLPVVALNGGPVYKLTEAFSFTVSCESQQEVDKYWDRLSAGGTELRCGWLNDKFGLTWQIVPTILPALLGDPDRARAGRAMQAMMSMKKLDIAALQKAGAGA
jgi:predicted 3-demethylubiquinone-9 3-methyltransferase (glyoxalase superfamily)